MFRVFLKPFISARNSVSSARSRSTFLISALTLSLSAVVHAQSSFVEEDSRLFMASAHFARAVSEKHGVNTFGPDGQSLKKNIVLTPGRWGQYDPFLLMAEDWFSLDSGGFPHHPHRGFETVTVVLDGELEHEDSKGNRGVLGPGDVQWMTAAGGIIHSEIGHKDSVAHVLQLWLNLPAKDKMGPTHYQDLLKDKIPLVITEDGRVTTRVISGKHGDITGPAKNFVPVLALQTTMTDSGRRFTTKIPSSYNGFVYVLSGRAKFGSTSFEGKEGDVLLLPPSNADVQPEDEFVVESQSANVHFVLFAGRPLHEPVFARGPFVMDSQERLLEAYRDYQRGEKHFIH